jgi:DNA-binding FrmR family transcriptional regulator
MIYDRYRGYNYNGGFNVNECKKSHHDEKFKADLILRLNKIEGQIRGIKRMIETDTYCDEVLNQITSVRAALASVQEKLLLAHMQSCVLQQIKNGEDKVIVELTETIKRMIK